MARFMHFTQAILVVGSFVFAKKEPTYNPPGNALVTKKQLYYGP